MRATRSSSVLPLPIIHQKEPIMRRVLTCAAIIAAVLAITATSALALAKFFDHQGSLGAGGRPDRVSGQFRCGPDARVTMRVTLSQRKTGAAVQGTWRGSCREARHFVVTRFTPKTAAGFEPGGTEACALAITRRHGRVIDADQWCSRVRLVR